MEEVSGGELYVGRIVRGRIVRGRIVRSQFYSLGTLEIERFLQQNVLQNMSILPSEKIAGISTNIRRLYPILSAIIIVNFHY